MSTEPNPVPDPSWRVAFTVQHQPFSGLRVDRLKVRGDVQYKPFKGVRMVGKAGRVEVRW
jgi:AP-3 complex subunit mu